MVNYALVFELGESTTEATPESKNLTISKGIIRRIGFHFDTSADNTSFVRLEYHGHLVAPSNSEGYIIGDAETIDVFDAIPVLEAPFILTAKGWNTKESHNTVLILVTVEECGEA